MNNNNIYFSCFSLIRACLSSLFDNFSKVVCVCLIVCFVLVSPAAAFASTTESMIMYSMNTRSIPNDSYTMVDITSGLYNIDSNSYQWGNVKEVTDGASSFITSNLILNSSINFDKYYPCFRVRYRPDPSITSNGSVGSYLSTCRMVLSSVRFWVDLTSTGDTREYDLTNSAVPFNAVSNIKYHFNTYEEDGSVNYDVNEFTSESLSFSNYNFTRGNPNVENSYFGFTFDASSSKQYTTENIRAGSIDYIEYIVTYDFNSVNFGKAQPTTADIPNSSNHIRVLFGLNTPVNVNVLLSEDGQYNNDNQFISNSINNVTTQISQVKTQLTQTTNTITSKIDTMSQSIQTGLENVVSSAQQNTQNIINTVTQKVDQVKETVTEVKDSILDLPNKIQEMLLGLIVPDSQTMADKYSEFSGLLEEKLGVIYQIPEMILELFQTLLSGVTDPQTTLTFPSLSLPWIDGTQMKLWDSIEFEIIPTGMDVLKELIQTVTSMVCVIMTFNSVKRIYENFLRGR